jgi:hypothetical protein
MANRYWVGGTATWDGTAGSKWALTSGGTGGQAVPTTADTVFFNASSGSNTVTIGTGAVCSTLTMTGFTGTLAFGTNTISTAGTGTVYVGATTFSVTGTPLINLTNSSSSNRTINAGATTEANSISFNISAGSGSTTITASTSVKNLTFSGSYTGAHASSAYTIYGNLTFKSGMTITAGTAIRTFAATSGTQQITSAALNLDFPLTFSGTATYQLQDNLSVGTSTSRTITLTTGTLGLNNFTLTNFGIFSSNNSNTRAIAFGSSGVINNTRTGTVTSWDCATITNFTRTGTPYVKFTGTNTTASTITVQHGTTSGGTEDNSMSFYFDSSPTVNLSTTNWIYDLGTLSSWGGTVTNSSTNTYIIYGSFYGSGSVSYFGNLTFASTKSTPRYLPINSALSNLITINTSGTGVFNLQANSNIQKLNVLNGSFSTNAYTLDTANFDFDNSNTKSLTFNSQVNIASANSTGIFKGNLTNTTIDMTGSTLAINCNNSTITLDVPNLTYPVVSVVINSSTPYGNFIFGRGATTQTITNLTIKNNVDPNDALTDFNVKLFAGSTLNVVNISIDGIITTASPNYVILSSTTAGTQATLSKASGTVSVSYVQIQDSIATGGATWLAQTTNGNIDNGNNTGWIFGAYSANNSNFLAFF